MQHIEYMSNELKDKINFNPIARTCLSCEFYSPTIALCKKFVPHKFSVAPDSVCNMQKPRD